MERIPKNLENTILSYIINHWKGELSLGYSYCNLIFVSIILAIVDKSLDFTSENFFTIFLVLIGLCLIFLFYPLVLIGLWRSATKHALFYKKKFWATIVKFILILNWIFFLKSFLTVIKNILI